MLKQLSIRNFALIEECTLHFGTGFSVITGETGAGKSVLMGALRTVVGGKTLATMIRTGAEKASVEAIFDISNNAAAKSILEALEIDADEDIIIQRDIFGGGKSRARVNGCIVNHASLEEIGETLVQMHGQSDQLLLRDLRTQLSLLDEYLGCDAELAVYAASFVEWNRLKEELKKIEEDALNLAEQKEFLTFQKNELEKAALRAGEEAELEEKTSTAAKFEAKMRAVQDLRSSFDGENGLMGQFELFRSKTRQFASRLPEMQEWLKRLGDAYDALSYIDEALQKVENDDELDPVALDRANSRLAQIQRLKRKYRTDEAGLIKLFAKRKQELDTLENLDADINEIKKNLRKAEEKLMASATVLSEKRKAGKATLDSKVEEVLHSLGMPKAKFFTDISEEAFSVTGKDRVEFCMAPNLGEGLKPLRIAVSGGELSRVLLAFKSVMAEQDRVPVLVFDEVDSGISGEVGNNVGEALRNLGKYHQVLSITHLQQVACRAQSHLAVEKHENDEGRTVSNVNLLSYEQRIVEIARMLGDVNSPTSIAHAKELLEETNAS